MNNITKSVIILLIFYLLSGDLFAQNGWQWVNPYPTGQSIYSMSFVNANTGIAVTTYGGTIMHTTNGGTNWKSFVPFQKSYFGCLMVDENTWLAGDVSDYYPVGIIRTTDSGLSWQEVYNSGVTGGFTSFSKYGQNLIFGVKDYIFLKSTNKGNNWSAITVSSYPQYLYSVQFINENTGFICGSTNLIYKTTNGGSNWNSIYNLDTIPYAFRSIMFKNENTGFVVSSDRGSVRTSNGGINWVHYPNQSGAGAFSGDFINVTGSYSTDFGLTWNNRDTVGYFLTFADSNTVYSCYEDNRKILKSTNKGVNWTVISKRYFDESFDFKITTKNESYVISRNKIFKTTNSGNSFAQIYFNNQYYFNSIDFSDSLKGAVAGSEGKLLITTNGGANWTAKYIGSSGLLYIKYVNNKIIILDSAINRIFISENNGINWDSVLISSEQSRLLEFVNENTGYAVSYGPGVYKTTNGGYNWFYVAGFHGNSIDFYDENTGIISGSTRFRRTYNGGLSWDTLSYPNQFSSNSIKLTTGQTVYSTGISHIVFKSTNCGSSWYKQNSYSYLNSLALKIDFLDSAYGYLMGSGTLLRTTSGGETNVGVKSISTEVPENNTLFQNYPNPLNSTSNIKFQLAKSGNVKIELYDILGRKVKELLNEYKPSGTYEISFDSSGLSSGVYFYRLTTGKFSSTKKLILLK